MDRFAFASLLIALVACSSEPPKGNNLPDNFTKPKSGDAGATESETTAQETSSTEPTTTTTTGGTAETSPTDAGASNATPDASAGPACALGDGLYCGNHGVPGNPNELYRCTGGVPVLEQTCNGECARFPDGINDRCSCWLGNGLYCGGNGVNGDEGTLFRCADGVVSVEKKCASGCSKQADGVNDRCF